jgi:hypothetical protein
MAWMPDAMDSGFHGVRTHWRRWEPTNPTGHSQADASRS